MPREAPVMRAVPFDDELLTNAILFIVSPFFLCIVVIISLARSDVARCRLPPPQRSGPACDANAAHARSRARSARAFHSADQRQMPHRAGRHWRPALPAHRTRGHTQAGSPVARPTYPRLVRRAASARAPEDCRAAT